MSSSQPFVVTSTLNDEVRIFSSYGAAAKYAAMIESEKVENVENSITTYHTAFIQQMS